MARSGDAVLLFALASLLALAGGHEFFSDEYVNVPRYDVVVPEGEKLKLKVLNYESRAMYIPRWYHNGKPVLEWRCRPNYGELECPSVSRYDAGRYELWGATLADGQRHLIFAAYVRVTRNEEVQRAREPVSLVVEDVPPALARYRERDDCFCSGVTGRCWMADNLYRSQVSYNLSRAEPVNHYLNPPELTSDQYLAISATVWGGNLVTSYGGYLRFPLTNECYSDRSKPCVVFVDKWDVAIGYFLPAQHDQRELTILMKESSWRLIAVPQGETAQEFREFASLDKFAFLSVLSNFRTLYIRGRNRLREHTTLTLDVASRIDEGMGLVNTVEECDCHQGYAGLSCERCEKGYIRKYDAINSNGICLTEFDLWQSYKRKYNKAPATH